MITEGVTKYIDHNDIATFESKLFTKSANILLAVRDITEKQDEISKRKADKGITITKIRKRTDLTYAYVHSIMDKFVEAGIFEGPDKIERSPGVSNIYTLTSKGLQILEHIEIICSLLRGISNEGTD